MRLRYNCCWTIALRMRQWRHLPLSTRCGRSKLLRWFWWLPCFPWRCFGHRPFSRSSIRSVSSAFSTSLPWWPLKRRNGDWISTFARIPRWRVRRKPELIHKLFDWLVPYWLSKWLFSKPTLVSLLIDWLIEEFSDWLDDAVIDWVIEWMIERLINHGM